eukprot:31295-Pelagococcus_subviridis.AAC.2
MRRDAMRCDAMREGTSCTVRRRSMKTRATRLVDRSPIERQRFHRVRRYLARVERARVVPARPPRRGRARLQDLQPPRQVLGQPPERPHLRREKQPRRRFARGWALLPRRRVRDRPHRVHRDRRVHPEAVHHRGEQVTERALRLGRHPRLRSTILLLLLLGVGVGVGPLLPGCFFTRGRVAFSLPGAFPLVLVLVYVLNERRVLSHELECDRPRVPERGAPRLRGVPSEFSEFASSGGGELRRRRRGEATPRGGAVPRPRVRVPRQPQARLARVHAHE